MFWLIRNDYAVEANREGWHQFWRDCQAKTRASIQGLSLVGARALHQNNAISMTWKNSSVRNQCISFLRVGHAAIRKLAIRNSK
jgi:hypothetical protein